MSAAQAGLSAGLNQWRYGPVPDEIDVLQQRYYERWLLAEGELFLDYFRTNQYKNDPRVYRNIALLWNHTTRVVDFYTTMVYQGALKDKPGEGAIPILPDKNLKPEQVTSLMAAIDVLNQKWNWQLHMVRRPKMGSALGDVMTELVDDQDSRFVYPRFVWPGYVKKIELDFVGNITSYTLEYQVTEVSDSGQETSYKYRKEVDRNWFRYFREDKPFDYYGEGSVVPNDYGFVPAVWDRHIVSMGNRGKSATDASRQALMGLNSLFSHSRDFQHKAFFAPIVVQGQVTKKAETKVDLSSPPNDPSAMATSMQFLEATGDNVGLHQPVFDIGKTLEQLQFMRDGILMNHPEATFFDKLAERAHVTGPGADRIILPVKGLTEHARSGYDNNQVHIYQMAISMIGMRVNNGDWGSSSELSKSRLAFKPFTVDSYKNEEMNFTIAERPIVIPSKAELVETARETESLQTVWGLMQAGLTEEQAKALIAEKRALYTTGIDTGEFGAEDFGEGTGS